MTYSGLFVRDNIGQTPTGGQSGWSGCPDIIFAGTSPASDPSAYTTTTGYGTDYGSTVYINQVNYVYLRALNTTAAPLTGQAWFYYTQSDLMLWPSNWQTAGVIVDGLPMNNQQIIASAANQVCVTNAFVWTPPTFSGSSGDHYCCIVWMENPPLQPPPWNPLNGIPNFTTCDELANFVCSHPNMGWRNTVDVSGAGPTWQQTTSITGPAAGGQFQVGIQCDGMPTNGGTVGYAIPGSNGVPTVNAQNIPIYDPNASPMTTVTWPPGHTASITVTYTQGSGSAPPAGASIAPSVNLPATSVDAVALRLARIHQPWRFTIADMHDEHGQPLGVQTAVIIFGSTPYTF